MIFSDWLLVLFRLVVVALYIFMCLLLCRCISLSADDCSCSTTHPMESVSHQISTTDHFSKIRDKVESVGIDLQFANTVDEI